MGRVKGDSFLLSVASVVPNQRLYSAWGPFNNALIINHKAIFALMSVRWHRHGTVFWLIEVRPQLMRVPLWPPRFLGAARRGQFVLCGFPELSCARHAHEGMMTSVKH